ncbi:flagellar basal body-associated protein FliL [Virgibacillus halodenitrificans]|uniref:Flagellar protein FliL n=1 Tax=Virgibacillus halodenitrificans TaxID=1482 RepID=A0AAC9NLD8_VIRHA|nr:flagellar basal body-associated protein FliL [Virgibacillus halodenitrificans]APC48624.1 flagellar basal body-associated protein FliL [Virgibacillus halodenitrificans]MCJ0931198.1 flagellar basal body-associated protein FliL [Virgibacillus halodenitrificans]
MSKLVRTTITSMAILLIVAIAALIVVLNISGDKDEGKAESIDKIVEYAYETPEITTDLEDGSFVRIQFQILTDGKDAKEEISKRDFQLKNILIKELATMNEEKFKTGLTDLEAEVKTKLNAVMTEGKITNVYTVSKILQ